MPQKLYRRAYTIGAEKSYDTALSSQEPVFKIGQQLSEDPPYPGGWVWSTPEEAFEFIKTTDLKFKAAVYEIELLHSWEEDVYEPMQGVHHLLHDAQIIKKHLFHGSGSAPKT
jgi:hypothetical protein